MQIAKNIYEKPGIIIYLTGDISVLYTFVMCARKGSVQTGQNLKVLGVINAKDLYLNPFMFGQKRVRF